MYGIEAPMDQAQEIAGVLVGASEEVASSLRLLRNGADLGPHLVEIHRLENEREVDAGETVANVLEGISLKRGA